MTLMVSESPSSQLNPGIQSIIQRMGFIAEVLSRTGVDPLPASLLHLYVVPLSYYSHPLFSLLQLALHPTPHPLALFLDPTFPAYARFEVDLTLHTRC